MAPLHIASGARLSGSVRSVTYAYDLNGNRTEKNEIDNQAKRVDSTYFHWDAKNRLRRVDVGGVPTQHFDYDDLDRRIRKAGDTRFADPVLYVWDELAVLAEYGEDPLGISHTELANYAFGVMRLAMTRPGFEAHWLQSDPMGSTANITQHSNGGLVEATTYDPYGQQEVLFTSGDGGWNRIGFTGHEYDPETDLTYAKARYYDQDLGIFLGQDPVLGSFDTPPSLHRYLYANSNPFMYVDPTGRVAWLKKVADWFGDGADAAIDIASDLDFGDGVFANAAEGYIAFSLGSLAGIQRAAQGAVSSVNLVSNVAVVSSGLAIRATGLGEADFAVGSLKELNQIEEDLGVAVDFAKEAAKNPGKVLHAAGSAVQEYAGRLASGDTRAIAQTSAFVTELVIDVATGNAAKKGAEALGDMGEAVAEQSIKQSKKARKASVLVEGKKTPKTAPKKVKAPDSPGGGNKGPTPGFQEYAKKDAAIQRQVRRAELDQKFGRSGDLDADITSGGGYTQRPSSNSVSPTVGELRRAKLKDAHHIIQEAAVRDLPGYKTNSAPGVQLPGGGRGTPHHAANQVQKQRGGGTYAAERRI